MLQIKFYLDEHVPAAVCKGLRRRGVDVLTVEEAGRSGMTDDALLAFALKEGESSLLWILTSSLLLLIV